MKKSQFTERLLVVHNAQFIIFVLFVLVLSTGCGAEALVEVSTDEATVTATTVAIQPTIEPIPTNESTPLPEPTVTITPVPTAVSWTMSAEAGTPPELASAAQEMVAENGRFTWSDQPGDVQLGTPGEIELGVWTYAVAAPFPTLMDNITLVDLQSAWNDGSLTLTADVAAALQTLWGKPSSPAIIVPEVELVDALWQAQANFLDVQLTVLPFDQLSPRLKVLRVDGAAPIDTDFDPTGYALTLPFGLTGDAEAAAEIQADWGGPLTNRDENSVTTVAMSGPAGMRRAVADRMDKYGHNYPAEETGPIMQAVDIAHMSNENAFAPNCPPADPFDSVNVCNRDEYVDLMTWMGIDVNEMTGNHLNDWGEWALIHTLDLYHELGIETYGGGYDLEDAAQPLLMEHNGNKIAFVGCNPTGPEFDWAGPDNPGSLPCNDYSQIYETIGQLDAEGYNVIVTLQYLEDYQYQVLDPQRETFGALAEAGATAVSGSHGHHPQGFAFVEDGFIHYGLGNLLADQMWSLGGRQTFIDTYLFYNGRLLNVDLWTGLNEDYARIRKMTPEERAELLTNAFEASDW